MEIDPILKAIEEIVNNDESFELNLEAPESQLQSVITMLEVATRLTARVAIKYRTARRERKKNDAAVRRSMIANNSGPRMTEQQLADALECDPRSQMLSATEAAYEVASDNLRSFMDLYHSYRETLFRLVSLKSAETRNIR